MKRRGFLKGLVALPFLPLAARLGPTTPTSAITGLRLGPVSTYTGLVGNPFTYTPSEIGIQVMLTQKVFRYSK